MEKSKNEEIKLTENVTHLDMPGFQEIATNRTYKGSLFRLIYSGNDERSRRWQIGRASCRERV